MTEREFNRLLYEHDIDRNIYTLGSRQMIVCTPSQFIMTTATIILSVAAVTDDGPGMIPEHQQRVFAMFQTLKPRDEVEGSGMGLALVKKTVEGFGGWVTLESDGDSGCTFCFMWPITIENLQ